MKRTFMALIQLAVLGGLTLAGLLMTLTFISTVLKIFAFILGEWIYTALIVFIGALFILIPVGYAVSVLLKHIEHSNKEYESSHAREYRLRKEANEKKGNCFMKKKIIQLYKDTHHHQLNYPFTFTFILGVIFIVLLSLILFIAYSILSFVLSFFPNMSIEELLLILLIPILSTVGILFIGALVSASLDEWSGL